MGLVKGKASTQVDRREDDLIPQFYGPSVSDRQLGQESISQIRIGHEQLLAFELFGQQRIAHQCRPECFCVGKAHRIATDELILVKVSNLASKGQQCIGRYAMHFAFCDHRIDVLDGHANITADSDHLDLRLTYILGYLMDNPPDLRFEDGSLLGMGGLESIDLFEHPKRT